LKGKEIEVPGLGTMSLAQIPTAIASHLPKSVEDVVAYYDKILKYKGAFGERRYWTKFEKRI